MNPILKATLVGTFFAFVFNLLIATVASTFAYEGTWSWDAYFGTLGGLFGDLPSLFALLGVVAIAVLMGIGVYRLSKNHPGAIVVVFFAGVILGGFILWKLVDWSSFGFGFGPFVLLVIASMVESLILVLVANAIFRKSIATPNN